MAGALLPYLQILRQILEYNPNTGLLYWKPRTEEFFEPKFVNSNGNQVFRSAAYWAKIWNDKYAFQKAGSIDNKGYVRIKLKQKVIAAHRAIWLIHYGEEPGEVLDHINGITTDNRIENLRSVDISGNCKNIRIRNSSTSGVIGVGFYEGKWRATITSNRKNIFLGYFKDKESAIRKRKEAEVLYGFHQNHGRR